MRIREILNEGFFSRTYESLKNLLAKVVNSLKFGESKEIKISGMSLSEAKGQDKGANGRIAEYSCAYHLAEGLRMANFRVISDVDKLKQMYAAEIKKYDRSLSPEQINVAMEAGNKMAESMYYSILNNGKDLVFTEYEFRAGEHTFDIEPTGAAQNKGSTDDLVIHIKKDDAEITARKILLSLKVSASSQNSQGSKSPMPLLWKMFVDPVAKTVKPADFIRVFGEKGREFVNALEDFKNAGKEFLNSPEGKTWAKEKEAERIARGKSVSASKVKPDTNFFRAKEVGDYFSKTRGYSNEHKLSKLFVELYNDGKVNLNNGDWKRFNEGFKQAIGFDSVITYKAICDKAGIKVENSATSQAYQQLYQALESQIDVVLTNRPNSGGIGVSLVYGNTVIDSLSCSIWKDGTIQFKFDSA